MGNKVLGYSLVFLGIVLIFFSFFSVFSVFTKRSQPVVLFNFDGITVDVSDAAQISLPPELEQAGVSINQPKMPPQEIVSSRIINETSNVFAHLLYMGFIATIGLKLASIGTQLVRPIVVKTNVKSEAKNEVNQPQ